MTITFSFLVTTFFSSYLVAEQGLSPNTVASYSDCMKLLLIYVSRQFNIKPETIDIQMITPEVVLDFLDSIENKRGNCPATRNQRLAAIKTFFHFLSGKVPELMLHNERIQALKQKKTCHLPPTSLTVEEVNTIIDAPDDTTLLGARDKALLQIMYNTGARVQELADLSVNDLHFNNNPTVTLTGKGRKTRVIPLWQETVDRIFHYLQIRESVKIDSGHLFLNTAGNPMTRFGIGRRIDKHAQTAIAQCPSLSGRRITPHVFRHTTALHLIEAGNDIAVVKDWLGHADIKTTSLYLEVSIERKRKALEKLPPPDGGMPAELPKWKQPDLMSFLTSCSRRRHYVA